MIKSIEIKYPEFNLDIKRNFNPWVNLLEEVNWYWKTTIFNTITSFYTGKFPWLKKLPDWIVNLELTTGRWMMNKSKWIGSPEPNELYNYIIPWRFFSLSAIEQRRILTKLLNLDINVFIRDKLEYYYIWIEKDINRDIKESIWREQIILSDITRYKSILINFKEKDFNEITEFNKLKDEVYTKTLEYNDIVRLIKESNTINENKINHLNENIKTILNQIDELNKEIDLIRLNSNCNLCWNSLSKDDIDKQLNKLFDKLKIRQDWIILNEDEIVYHTSLLQEDKDYLNILDYIENAKMFWIELPEISEEVYEEQKQYNIEKNQIELISKELDIKEQLLKWINTIELQNRLDEIVNTKIEFTKYLEKVIQNLPFKIELFKVYKNWNIDETFNIKFKWIDYNNLSTWNKNLISIMIAKLFIDNLRLDFILIDEASNISKDNLDYIKELWLSYQVILAKPTWWTLTDIED